MLIKPSLILDEAGCKRNIRMMAEKARDKGVAFRPHFKTHVSLQIGEWFRDEGVSKITVSSLSMAEYFSGSWQDITIAFPVNILEIDTINVLAGKIRLKLLIESVETISYLKQHLVNTVSCFIKIDTGYHRTGILPENSQLIDEILEHIDSSETIDFAGFLTHAGHTYKCSDRDEILKIHDESRRILGALREKYTSRYPDMILSIGDTPSCSVSEDFAGIDEIRPGNFVFYDLMQLLTGSCTIDQIAVAMACPVVAVHPERNEIVIYGGGVHFSKESVRHPDYGTIFGLVVDTDAYSWGKPVDGMFLKSISQEHGIVSATDVNIKSIAVGDLLYIIPVHSCMTAHVMGEYITLDGETISRMK